MSYNYTPIAVAERRGFYLEALVPHTLSFFSRSLSNVDKSWNKVKHSTQELNFFDKNFDVAQCYLIDFLLRIAYFEEPIACCLEVEE